MKYFHSSTQHKTYKLHILSSGIVHLFWVSVYRKTDGSFLHARGLDVIDSESKALDIMEAFAKPTDEDAYINALKDYFAIDKKVREEFIKTYKL